MYYDIYQISNIVDVFLYASHLINTVLKVGYFQ